MSYLTSGTKLKTDFGWSIFKSEKQPWSLHYIIVRIIKVILHVAICLDTLGQITNAPQSKDSFTLIYLLVIRSSIWGRQAEIHAKSEAQFMFPCTRASAVERFQ